MPTYLQMPEISRVWPTPRAGRQWEDHELVKLTRLFAVDGLNINQLAEEMGRGRDSAVSRLRILGLLGDAEPMGRFKFRYRLYTPEQLLKRVNHILFLNGCDRADKVHHAACNSIKPKEQIIMNPTDVKNAPFIETKVFIAGVDASTLTDAQIFDKIVALEASIARWDKVQNKPKKLGAMIESMHADIKALVEYVDGR